MQIYYVLMLSYILFHCIFNTTENFCSKLFHIVEQYRLYFVFCMLYYFILLLLRCYLITFYLLHLVRGLERGFTYLR